MWQKVKDFFRGLCKKKENEEKVEIDLDSRKEMLSSVGTTVVDGAKIMMATLLSIFVPQYCPETGATCTLEENIYNLSDFNLFVLIFNFISLGFFVKLSYVINKRELYFISHLDDSRDHAYNSLHENMKLYPKYMRRIKEFNNTLYKWTKWTTWMYAMNVIFSCILIFHFYMDGFRSVTVTISNVMLVSNKLYQSIETCKECLGRKPLALSMVKLNPISYNVIDFNYSILNKGRKLKKRDSLMSIKLDRKKSFRKIRSR